MKKILTTLIIAAFSLNAQAQVSFGLEAGVNLTKYRQMVAGTNLTTNIGLGGRFGAIADIPFDEHFSLQPGLFFIMHDYKATNSLSILGTTYTSTSSVRFNGFEVPLYVQWASAAPGENRFFAGVGPFIDVYIGGKVKNSQTGYNDTTFDVKVGNDSTKDDVQSFNIGVGGNVGYMLANGFFARAQFQYGFRNMTPAGNTNNEMHLINYAITVGYMFGGHGKKGGPDKM